MSFILDALKKSESERQRKAGPALYEVKLAPPRNKLPWWMVAVGVLLGVNLIFVIWLLMRSPSPAPISAATGTAPAADAALSGATVGRASGTPSSAPPVSVPAAPRDATAPQALPAPQSADVSPTLSSAAMGPGAPQTAGSPETRPGTASDDLAPALEQAPAGAEHVRTTTEAGLPTYRDIAANNNRLPPLHLDFHLFAARPQDRFVFINMKKLHEGEATPEGVRVESINDEGAVLSFEGTRFTLLHE